MTETQHTADETDAQGSNIYIQSGGDLWRSMSDIVTAFVDEAIFEFEDDEDEDPRVRTEVVDVANVAMLSVEVPAESFSSFVSDGSRLGLDLSELGKTTQYARKGRSSDDSGDPLVLRETDGRVYIDVHRPDMSRRSSFRTLSTDAMRPEPDRPDLPLKWEGTVDVSTLRDALRATEERFDSISLSTRDHEADPAGNATSPLCLYSGETDGDGDVTREDGFKTRERVLSASVDDDEPTPVRSLYSLDYLVRGVDALSAGGVERVLLSLGDALPLSLKWSESTYGISGEFVLAPRVAGDGSEINPDNQTWEW